MPRAFRGGLLGPRAAWCAGGMRGSKRSLSIDGTTQRKACRVDLSGCLLEYRVPARTDPSRIGELVDTLERVYGRPDLVGRFDPVEELVCCILSQHTSDLNSLSAFERLRSRFADWESLAMEEPSRLADVIRSAGLANQKAKSILACLGEIKRRVGAYSLDFLRDMAPKDARAWLEDLPGVGPKTASIVLCFAFGMDVIPVDTHVYRVAWRLGLLPEKCGENKAHDLLLETVPRGLGFRFHIALIQHGRTVCRAQRPRCDTCLLAARCVFRAAQSLL